MGFWLLGDGFFFNWRREFFFLMVLGIIES